VIGSASAPICESKKVEAKMNRNSLMERKNYNPIEVVGF
jgi:hypothetical protein